MSVMAFTRSMNVGPGTHQRTRSSMDTASGETVATVDHHGSCCIDREVVPEGGGHSECCLLILYSARADIPSTRLSISQISDYSRNSENRFPVEPLLHGDASRYVLYPIKYDDVSVYFALVACFIFFFFFPFVYTSY